MDRRPDLPAIVAALTGATAPEHVAAAVALADATDPTTGPDLPAAETAARETLHTLAVITAAAARAKTPSDWSRVGRAAQAAADAAYITAAAVHAAAWELPALTAEARQACSLAVQHAAMIP